VNFSIVTPSFNQLDWLELCVASVRDQVALNAEGGNLKAETTLVEVASHFTGQENQEPRTKNSPPPLAVEHIIQDAGTPGIEDFARAIGADFYRDGKLIFSFSASQSFSFSRYRVAVYCESDRGMYSALNRGFARARGDVLAWLNCDEQYFPGALRQVAAAFHQNPAVDILWGDAVLLSEEGEPLSYRRMVVPHKAHTILCGLGTLSCSMFLRPDLVRDFPFQEDYRSLGDADFLLRLEPWRRQVLCLPHPLAAFTLIATSQTSRTTEEEKKTFLKTHGGTAAWMQPLLRLHHGWRKLRAGAYGRHQVQLTLRLRNHPDPVPWQGILNWRWPRDHNQS
jgi:glycosyltransferase involved in cell wall biosynthesis